MNDKPLITYIIPCFNQAMFLHESISSIVFSYSGPKEIIIIDDCSTDPRTFRFLNEIQEDFPEVKIIHHEINKGLSQTRNHGIQLSNGEYIQFLDADDILIPGKIDLQVNHFRLSPDCDISITDYLYCDEMISEFQVPEPCIGTFDLSIDDFLFSWERGLSIPIHCGLFKKSVFENIKFEEALRAKEDWLFWCELSLQKKKIIFINLPFAVYRLHSSAMTKSKINEMGRMWIKATLIIDELLKNKENFFYESLLWYENHYKNEIEDQKNNIHQKEDNSINISSVIEKIQEKYNNKHFQISQNKKFKKYFSIVVPVYNNFIYLVECFESILNQSYKGFEVICVDDNSTSNDVKKFLIELKDIFDNFKVFFNAKNEGISSTINKGIVNASNSYIVFLDCDDYLHPDALKIFAGIIEEFPNVDYFFTNKIDVDDAGNFLREALYGGYEGISPSGNIKNDLLDGMVASHLKIIKKEKIIEVGGFDSDLDGVQDYDLALRIAESGEFKYINQSLYYHRQHLNSITTSQTSRQFRKMNVARRNYLEKKYPKKFEIKIVIEYLKERIFSSKQLSNEELNDLGIKLFHINSISLDQVKEALSYGWICILDATVQYEQRIKYFIREYNSFFDLIIVDDSLIAISILGYLWNYNILWVPSLNQEL